MFGQNDIIHLTMLVIKTCVNLNIISWECKTIKYCLADAHKICSHFCHMEEKNESLQGSTRKKQTTICQPDIMTCQVSGMMRMGRSDP